VAKEQLPIQPVEKPIICSPYVEPDKFWYFDRTKMEMELRAGRREAGYYYKTDRVGAAQAGLFADEQWDDLPLINLLRKDVRRWRESGYRGASSVTHDLLDHWTNKERFRRLFFCQREAVETIIYLNELRIPARSSRTRFTNFALTDLDVQQLLSGDKPAFYTTPTDFYPTLRDANGDPSLLALQRMGCKMATGSGKTVLMAMLIAWAFCNRGQNPNSTEFPNAALVVCPNLTIRERLQVLRPEEPNNYYAEFDIVPIKYRPFMQKGKVLVTNWHLFNPRSEHEEGGKSYAVVSKGPDTPETFAKYVLGDIAERMPIMVLNDEGHHCYRPAPENDLDLVGEERRQLEQEAEEATVWIEGLDKLNNYNPNQPAKRGISICVDLSATPFYIKGSGHPEGRPFPWLVTDFGLVDAIESGIVKIPRLPVQDVTGRPDPKYFKLWQTLRDDLERQSGNNFFANGKPKPEPVYREAEGALQQLAGQWKERYEYVNNAKPGQEQVPPVMIVVCDNTDIAELFYRRISGETEQEIVTAEDLYDASDENGEAEPVKKKQRKPKTKTIYGPSSVLPEFVNVPSRKHTIRIDTKLLAEAESEDPNKNRQEAAEELRKVVATVGKIGQPGEHVRCVVSVAMLTEGWDANNVTHILGIRAFGSQLLCEQVVGRGLRRMDYTPDPSTGLLVEEYVDVYGIPFSVIPFKGRPIGTKAQEDKPKQHVRALPERKHLEIRFPIVEGYAFSLKHNLVRCDVDSMDRLVIEPHYEPTATFISATVGYREGSPTIGGLTVPTVQQDRHEYYAQNHINTIMFQIAKTIVEQLAEVARQGDDAKSRVLRLQSRHQLFPQVYSIVDEYVRTKVDFQGEHPSELGLELYATRVIERIRDRIEPDDVHGEPPLMPVLNRYKQLGSTEDVDFKTTKPCFATAMSHVNQVVADTQQWEQSAAFRLEMAARRGVIKSYAKNDRLGLTIPYDYLGIEHTYTPDYVVQLANAVTILLEIKGEEDNRDKSKHDAARRWISAVNNWAQQGRWALHVCRNPQLLEKELFEQFFHRKSLHELGEAGARSEVYLANQLGADEKWARINRSIWSAINSLPAQTLPLSQIDEIAKTSSSDHDEVLSVLAVLTDPGTGFLRLEYIASNEGKRTEVPATEVTRRLRAWWRDKSMSDKEWKSWAGSTIVQFRPFETETA
jgi:type III restriction enzyme